MALADLVQDVIIDMSGQHLHPKYVGTFRKVDAGMVSAAGTFMSFSMRVVQLVQEEEALYPPSPPPVFLMLHLTEEAPSLIFCSETIEDGGAAAASSSQRKEEQMEAYLQSKNVTCGICMDKVSCPQCRVRSAFYVPNKYWVEGQAKESLIAAFKEKCRKKSCIYYTRYRCCPFKTECLYRHDKPTRCRSFPYPTEDEDEYDGVDLLNFFIAMTLLGSGDDDDDEDFDCDFPFFITEGYDF
ncbi:uncharacterized protein V6R79_002130 [Siganus canaliculatus]